MPGPELQPPYCPACERWRRLERALTARGHVLRCPVCEREFEVVPYTPGVGLGLRLVHDPQPAPQGEHDMSEPYVWLSNVPGFKEWHKGAEGAMGGHTLEISFTQAPDLSWGGRIVKGEEQVGGPLSVEGMPSREACETALREQLSERLRAQMG